MNPMQQNRATVPLKPMNHNPSGKSRLSPVMIISKKIFSISLAIALLSFAGKCEAQFIGETGSETTLVLGPGTYYILAAGAQGGNDGTNANEVGGLGAKAGGQFTLLSTSTLTILVGQEGGTYGGGGGIGGGGGGGTYVVVQGSTPLVVAGGGGGGGGSGDGGPGLTGNDGGDAGAAGGQNGGGGDNGNAGGYGGGGLLLSGSGGSPAGQSFTSGGAGGTTGAQGSATGGFGGGGPSGMYSDGGGGGGGYSGGAGGNAGEPGGGGGSFVAASATNVLLVAGANPGNGFVSIFPVAVVSKNDSAPGVAGAKFLSVDIPAVDFEGDITFKAVVTGTGKKSVFTSANNTGIWYYSGTGGGLVAQSGGATGIPGATLTSLGDPALSNGFAIFRSGLKGSGVESSNNSAIWQGDDLAISLLARTGSSGIGGGEGTFKGFKEVAPESNGPVALLATYTGTGSKPETGLIGFDLSGSASTVFQIGDIIAVGSGTSTIQSINAFLPPPTVAGQGRNIDSINGNAAVELGAANKASEIVLAIPQTHGFSFQTIASTSGTLGVAGVSDAKWASLSSPIVNDRGDVAFLGTVSGTNSAVKIASAARTGIWLSSTSGFTSLIARTGEAFGNSSTPLAALDNPVLNNDGAVAFIGTLQISHTVTKSHAENIFLAVGGTDSIVATAGDAAPGVSATSATFASFQQLVFPDDGGPVFLASLDGFKGNTKANGIWSEDASGVMQKVIATGDTIIVSGLSKVVKSVSAFSTVPGVSGATRSFDAENRAVGVLATFSDGTWSILHLVAP